MEKILSYTALQSILRGIKSYATEIFSNFNLATKAKHGLMSAEDKTALDCDILSALREGTGVGPHNMIYRGKCLGSSVTNAQWNAIQEGTFENLWLGDYWTIDNNNWRISCFDYFLHCGDTPFETHHVIIVPDRNMYSAQMCHSESGDYEPGEINTTSGGYLNSEMRKKNLNSAKSIINSAFGESHVLIHRDYFSSVVQNGIATEGKWVDSAIELMNEEMVYGTGFFHAVCNGTTIPCYSNSKFRLPLFTARPDLICGHNILSGKIDRQSYWLRDIISQTHFALADAVGCAAGIPASYASGVRPYFLIG